MQAFSCADPFLLGATNLLLGTLFTDNAALQREKIPTNFFFRLLAGDEPFFEKDRPRGSEIADGRKGRLVGMPSAPGKTPLSPSAKLWHGRCP